MIDETRKNAKKAPLGTLREIEQPPPSGLEIISVLNRWQLQSFSREILPGERVCKCYRVLRAGSVQVLQSIEYKKSFYSGLVTCGSVWVCPICAAKISERRGKELIQAFNIWASSIPGNTIFMLTLTVPHYFGQSLSEVRTKFMKARRAFMNRKTYKRIMQNIDLCGSIYGLEVTFGANGWHVHTHELLFITGQVGPFLKGELLRAWQKAVVDAKLGMPNAHGLDLKQAFSPSEYLAKFGKDRKWGPEKEMTKSHMKRGRVDNLTPWDLLASAGTGDRKHRARFQEYAKNFKGCHQLQWSKKLRALLGLGPAQTDQEVADSKEEMAVLLGLLTKVQWRIVLRKDHRAELLKAADAGGWDGVLKFIQLILAVQRKI